MPKKRQETANRKESQGTRPVLSLPEFVARWKASTLTERSAAQSHFIDLCEVLGQQHPAAADQTGESYTFEKHVSKLRGGKGFTDVWKRGHFGWEYKGKHHDLQAAYIQLADYREDLENPPLLVVCDQNQFEVHTNFTGTAKRVYRFTLDELLSDLPTANCALPPLEVLRALFTNPDELRPEKAATRVTEQAAAEFAKLANNLERRGVDPERAAHFLMRLLFCLFGDSIGLLPDHLFRLMIEVDRTKPANFTRKLQQLFAAMCTRGNSFGMHDIAWFNGGLFADDEVFELDTADMAILRAAAALDWSTIEPAIFGTLFERSLNPGKRSQLGAHYTSKEDILLIVEPVVIAPLRKRWQAIKAEATALAEAASKQKGNAYTKMRAEMQVKLSQWVEELSKVRILDPACGSGNFLYLALRRMLDLWKEVYVFTAEHGLPTFLPHHVNPSQLYGLETNVYAHELASVVVWIGYLQWLYDNGIGRPTEPILRKLDNIQHRDSILRYEPNGKSLEPQWPEADFIIGNPPFLGGKKLRTELGNKYVEDLFAVYDGRVPREADLVIYWFEKARKLVQSGKTKRVGLLATQSIRSGANRQVLERIKESGNIFFAWGDRPWILDGASVRVAMIGFDGGSELERTLDGVAVQAINADLSSTADLTKAQELAENQRIAFQGPVKVGHFELTQEEAAKMLEQHNPNRQSNSLVIKPWMNASDITARSRNMWIIDFGEMGLQEASLFESPFEYVKQHVKEFRDKNNDLQRKTFWWRLGRSGAELRAARTGKARLIVTPRVAKFRIFTWASADLVPDSRLFAFARDDDYFFGVLHSKVHETWTLNTCSWHGVGNDPTYNTSSCFNTFPFPWPPGQEPKDDSNFAEITESARNLYAKREAWLNPSGASRDELRERTITNLYNSRPTWLDEAHRRLDRAVFAAYGWPASLSDAELLQRLLAQNQERAASQS